MSYSLLSPWAESLVGLPFIGIAGTVLGAAATTALLGHLGARRPRAGPPPAWSRRRRGRPTSGAGGRPSGSERRSGVSRAWSSGRTVGASRRGSPAAAWRRWPGGRARWRRHSCWVAAAAWWCGARSGAGGAPATAGAGRRPGPWLIVVGGLLPLVASRLLGAVSGPEPTSAHQMLAALAATGLTGGAHASRPARAARRDGWTAVLLLADLGWSAVRWGRTPCAWSCSSPSRWWWRSRRPAGGPVTLLAALAVCWLLPPVLVRRPGAGNTELGTLRTPTPESCCGELGDPRPGRPGGGGAGARPRGEPVGGPGRAAGARLAAPARHSSRCCPSTTGPSAPPGTCSG